jgi:L-ascorbate metabolism protein UlaG (beta-lactamase superfamily)
MGTDSLQFLEISSEQLRGPKPIKRGHQFFPYPHFSQAHFRMIGYKIFLSTQWIRILSLLNRTIRAITRLLYREWSPFEACEFFPKKAREHPSTIYAHDVPHSKDCSSFSYYFIGHASALLEVPIKSGDSIKTCRTLIDPIDGAIHPLFYPRMTRPACTAESLPKIDVILLSHNHRDHFSKKTLRKLVHHRPVVICPQGDEEKVKALGYLHIFSFNWFERATLSFSDGKKFCLSITPTPAFHSSGTSFSDERASLFSGYVIESSALDGAIYIAGDTAKLHEDTVASIFRQFPIGYSIQPGGPDEPHHLMQSSHQPSVQALFIHLQMIKRLYFRFIEEKGRLPTFDELQEKCSSLATIFTHIDTFRLGVVHFQETKERIARFRKAMGEKETALPAYEKEVLENLKAHLFEIHLKEKNGYSPITLEELNTLLEGTIYIPKIGQLLSF